MCKSFLFFSFRALTASTNRMREFTAGFVKCGKRCSRTRIFCAFRRVMAKRRQCIPIGPQSHNSKEASVLPRLEVFHRERYPQCPGKQVKRGVIQRRIYFYAHLNTSSPPVLLVSLLLVSPKCSRSHCKVRRASVRVGSVHFGPCSLCGASTIAFADHASELK